MQPNVNQSHVCVYCQPTAELLTQQICQGKLFFFFPLTRFSESSGSRSIKGLRRMKEIQNESVKRISHCQMFYMKYSTICLFAVILFDVCWGVVTRLFDMNQMGEHWRMEGGGTGAVIPPLIFAKHGVRSCALGIIFEKNTTKSNRLDLVIGDATSKMTEIKRRWRDLLGFDV